jgi:threonine dehydrogenase-like Zn-dependent dehydrogenase
MKAIALVPGTDRLRLVDRPEPEIAASDQVKVRVLQVGICGTDRDEAAGGRAEAPPGKRELVIGHEMMGQVVAVGPAVSGVQPGDYAVFTVRRGCGHCPACAIDRADMCYTGDYAERGIKGRDGYQAEYVVDSAHHVVKVPNELASVGVLTEPMSVAEKAIDEATRVQVGRLPDADGPTDWLRGKQVLIAGLGPIGLLAAFALRLRGAKVLGLDVVDRDSSRPALLRSIGGDYVDGRQTEARNLSGRFGHIDVVLEATGVAHLEFDLLSALGTNGVYVLTGVPGGDRPMTIDGADLVRRLVLGNQVMVGSVNADHTHFRMAVDDLLGAQEAWGEAMRQVITQRLPYTDFARALSRHPPDEIKTVLEWAPL